MATVPRPVPLPVNADGIPDALKQERRWVVWQYVWVQQDGRWDKVPYKATDISKKASSTNRASWAPWGAAIAAYERGGFDGVGFVLGDPFFALDVDHCLSAGSLPAQVRRDAELLDTYAEISPGGDGLHVIGMGHKPGVQCRATRNGLEYELYSQKQYLTITGVPVPGLSVSVAERQNALDSLYAQLFPANTTRSPSPSTAPAGEDDALIERAFASRDGAAFRRLYEEASTGYESPSQADSAFCLKLAFWTGRNVEQMDRIFRRSLRMRPKWDEQRGAVTYGARTLKWAVNNTHTVYHSSQNEAPPCQRMVPQKSLAEVHAVFRRWLGGSYDIEALNAVLATVAAEQLSGDPLWLLVVGGPGNAKTETVRSLEGVGALITSTIASEGALLSASPRKEHGSLSTGGLLRRLGDHGILVLKDVTSVLTMHRDARAAVLAALREIHDGRWERNVGVDGGRSLTWTGRIGLIGAVTTAWDAAHSVISTMGDRFVLVRLDSFGGRESAGQCAMANTGQEEQMRTELADAVAGVIHYIDVDQSPASTEDERARLLAAANLTTLCRTGVEVDYQGRPIDAHAPEMPTRFAKQLTQLVRGALAIGMSRDAAMRLAIRCARDSMPPPRLAILLDVASHPATTVYQTRKRLDRPWSTVDRQMQALQLLRVLTYIEEGGAGTSCGDGEGPSTKKTRWLFSLAEGINPAALALSPVLSVPIVSLVSLEGVEAEAAQHTVPTPCDISGDIPPVPEGTVEPEQAIASPPASTVAAQIDEAQNADLMSELGPSADADRAPSPPSTMDSDAMTARVPFMITRRIEQDLLQLGYTQSQINALTPSDAHRIIMRPELQGLGYPEQMIALMPLDEMDEIVRTGRACSRYTLETI